MENKKSYSELQDAILTKTCLVAFLFTIAFQLVFGGGLVLNWSLLIKFFIIWALILVVYRWGEKESEKEWLKYIKEQEKIRNFVPGKEKYS